MKKTAKFLRWFLGIVFATLGLTSLVVYLLLRWSLPQTQGQRIASGLGAEVRIRFDTWGVPSIEAQTREDVAYALGYVHGMDRFYQMDMTRRFIAGELSEMLGKATVSVDRDIRRFQYRKRARRSLDLLSPEQKKQLGSYAAGVNAGLNSLKTRPFEYWLLFQKPKPWKPEDCLLLAYAYYNDMQGNDAALDKTLITLYEKMPKQIADFFAKQGNPWQSAIDGSTLPILPLPDDGVWQTVVKKTLPGASSADQARISLQDPVPAGSNQWAVAADDTREGRALVANDPHLITHVPGIWYRAAYRYRERETGEWIEANGFTLPGIPSVVIGQSRWTAWGFTVSDIDSQDLVEVIWEDRNQQTYRDGERAMPAWVDSETIHVRGSQAIAVEVIHTRFGPIVWKDAQGRSWAMRWTALQPDAVNLKLFELETCRNLEELLDCANACRLPVMNCIAGDVNGNVGWTLFGSVPKRVTPGDVFRFQSRHPEFIWSDTLGPGEVPQVIREKTGVVWSANNRVLGGEHYRQLGVGTHAIGSRAYQIEHKLMEQPQVDREVMMQLQHDIEVPFLRRWQTELIRQISACGEARFERMLATVRNWDGTAGIDSQAYAVIRAFRVRIVRHYCELIFDSCFKGNPDFNPYLLPYEESIFQLLHSESESGIADRFVSFRDAITTVLEAIDEEMVQPKNRATPMPWGPQHRLKIQHPLAQVIPQLGRFLNMPSTSMEGDSYCPKVINGSHVASMRMVATPGEMERSFFQMPTGQSGHPMSRHYDDLHLLWLGKTYLPMLPETFVDTLTLRARQKTEPSSFNEGS